MKKSISFAIFLSAFIAGMSCRVSAVSISPPVDSLISLVPPAASLDLSDLDLRDGQNRPIRSKKALLAMRLLFTNRLNDMLIYNLTPAKRRFLLWTSTVWDTASGWIKRRAIDRLSTVAAWLQVKKIRIVRILIVWHKPIFQLTGSSSSFDHDRDNRFLYLLDSLLSSIVLLR